VQRCSLFLKLANSAVGSWTQLDLIAHHHLQTPWFREALDDLHLVLPGVRCVPTMVQTSPYLSSSARWSEENEWLCVHARALPTDLSGQRFRPCDSEARAYSKQVRAHISYVCKKLRTLLIRKVRSQVYQEVVFSTTNSSHSKSLLLALRLQTPGLPLHLALDAVALPANRSALASFLCADWSMGVHACNYFARNLLPALPRHQASVQNAGVERNSVCLACWHFRRDLVIEDEFHVTCVCPEYRRERSAFLLGATLTVALNTLNDMMAIMFGSDLGTSMAFSSFLGRARQTRRHLKLRFERLSKLAETRSFATKRAAWRMKGRPSCRHSVLFLSSPPGGCKCMALHSDTSDWDLARFMPCLSHDLKMVVATAFDRDTFERLALLQSRSGQIGW